MSSQGDISLGPSQCFYDCSNPPDTLQPYGDIGGIGVILSFSITSWMVVLLLIGYYLVAYNPELDAFRGMLDHSSRTQYPNPVDRMCLEALRKIKWLNITSLSKGNVKNATVERTLNKIITGISLLISGFVSLNCGLSEYHWQILVQLAWFSSITHLSALSFLRHYLHNRRKERFWRALSMFLLLVLLSVAVGITAHFSWLDSGTSPQGYAICAFSSPLDRSSTAFDSMLFTVFLLIYSYSVRVAKMTKPFANGLRRLGTRLKDRSLDNEEKWRQDVYNQDMATFRTVMYQPVWIAILRVAHVHLDLITSFLAEVYWVAISAAWGTKRLIQIRRHYGPDEEDTWTFGQILPLALLLSPIVSVIEHFTSDSEEHGRISGIGSYHEAAPGLELRVLDINENQPRQPSSSEHHHRTIASPNEPVGRSDNGNNYRADYESSVSFRCLTVLIIVYYMEIGEYLLIYDPREAAAGYYDTRGFVTCILDLIMGTIVFNPTLQLIWVMLIMWLEKIDMRPTVAATVEMFILLFLIMISLVEYFDTEGLREDKNYTLKLDLLTIALLLIAYGLLLGCTVLTSAIRLRTNGWRREYLLHHAITLAAGILLLSTLLLVEFPSFIELDSSFIVLKNSVERKETYLILAAALVGVQSAWLLLEYIFERSGVSKTPRTVARGLGTFVVCVGVTLHGDWGFLYYNSIVSNLFYAPRLIIVVLTTAGFWIIVFLIRDIVTHLVSLTSLVV